MRVPGTCEDYFTFNEITKVCDPKHAVAVPKSTFSVRFQKGSENFQVITILTEGQNILCKLTPTIVAENLTCKDFDWLNDQQFNVSNDLKCFK